MENSEETGPQKNSSRTGPRLALLAVMLVLTAGISFAAACLFDRPFLHQSLFVLSNLVGPTTQSLLNGGGLTVCTTEMGTPGNPICFHAGRMPLPSLVIAAGVRSFGDSFDRVALFKTVLFLLPVEVCIWLVWRRMPRSRLLQTMIALLLLAPFTMTSFLANVVNLQVEEGYAYSLLALAVGILFFVRDIEKTLVCVVFFAIAIDGLYLAKSSMVLAAAVLTAAFFLQLKSTGSRLLLLVLVAAAPLGWALHQHHASGHYSVGTSLDGINLHKANVATFLDHYPPPAGSSLDQYDAELNRGMSFHDEWSYNDFHEHAALTFIAAHPADTLRGDGRKLWILFFSLTKYGSTTSHGALLAMETAGLLLSHVILWAAIGFSVFAFVSTNHPEWRGPGVIFLALVPACVLPYIAGFAYTRHASVLIYPGCLLCCRLLCGVGDSQAAGLGHSAVLARV